MKIPHHYRVKNSTVFAVPDTGGNEGFFEIPHYKIGNYQFFCIISSQNAWEHVSVTVHQKKKAATRCPTWEEMCFIKNLFWDKHECVMQLHPPESEYVNEHKFCLHLWRPITKTIPIPMSLAVGTKQA